MKISLMIVYILLRKTLLSKLSDDDVRKQHCLGFQNCGLKVNTAQDCRRKNSDFKYLHRSSSSRLCYSTHPSRPAGAEGRIHVFNQFVKIPL